MTEPITEPFTQAEPTQRINGVPLLLAPADDNRVTGGIVFRVGTANETPPVAGITHLIEHLAISAVYTGSAHENGQTTGTATVFHATGTMEQVVTYLNGVCAALRNPPLARLEQEKQIIRTEAEHRDDASPLRRHRYGAGGHGIAGLDEFGMYRVTEQDVQRWIGTWFTGGNAVAFLTATSVPEHLDLSLPDGPRQPDPDPHDILAATPAHISEGTNGIALEGITERSIAATVFARLAGRELFARLREEHAYSYATDAVYRPRDATTASVALFADARSQTVTDMSTLFLRIVQDLRTREVSAAELGAAVAHLRRDLEDATPARMLPSRAVELLQQRSPSSAAENLADAERVTVEDIHRVAGQVWDTALINCDPSAVPVLEAAGVGPAMTETHLPLPDSDTVSFTKTGFNLESMSFGTSRVTYRNGRNVHTVLFAECPAVLCWPDGGRALMAPDASYMIIEPTLYSGLTAAKLSRFVDERMDPARLVPLPERPPEAIPQFTKRHLAYTLGLTVLLAISIPLFVAAIVAGITDSAYTGIGLAVLGSPFWIGTAWMIVAGRRRKRG